MSDLISRQAAIDALVAETIYTEEELKEYYEANSHRNEWVNGIYEAAERIKQLPPIQPEIVRCGECKWFQCNMRTDGYLPQGVDEFECRHWCGSCDPTDFCSYGEKERGGQDG